jgi:aspartate/methionine/tyrosine aminotransferase
MPTSAYVSACTPTAGDGAARLAVDVARRLAMKTGVLARPGSYFGPGQEAHLRFAYANPDAAGAAATGARLARLRELWISWPLRHALRAEFATATDAG